MLGPGHLDRPLERPQRLPAALRRHRRKTQLAGHPGRHLRTRPEPAIGRWPLQTLLQPGKYLWRQDRWRPPVMTAPIAQRPRALGVVARQQLFQPAFPIARQSRNFRHRMALRQQPDRLVMPRRRRRLGRPIVLFQLRNAQMPRYTGHPSILRDSPQTTITNPNSFENPTLPSHTAGVGMRRRLRSPPARRGPEAISMGLYQCRLV